MFTKIVAKKMESRLIRPQWLDGLTVLRQTSEKIILDWPREQRSVDLRPLEGLVQSLYLEFNIPLISGPRGGYCILIFFTDINGVRQPFKQEVSFSRDGRSQQIAAGADAYSVMLHLKGEVEIRHFVLKEWQAEYQFLQHKKPIDCSSIEKCQKALVNDSLPVGLLAVLPEALIKAWDYLQRFKVDFQTLLKITTTKDSVNTPTLTLIKGGSNSEV